MREIPPAEHLAFLETRPSASFLQTPAWGLVKAEWRRESLGFFAGDELVGVALVLYRQLPRLKRYLAYVPGGAGHRLDRRRPGPLAPAAGRPLPRSWRLRGADGSARGDRAAGAPSRSRTASPTTAYAASATWPRSSGTPSGARVVSQLESLGWRHQGVDGGFAAGQPQFVFQVPLVDDEGAPLDEDAVLKAMNQQWRRNIKKAAKAGVEVQSTSGVAEALEALPAFHELYVHTAERDHFTPRPLAYFRTMVEALAGEGEQLGQPDRLRLHLARHEGDLVAATIAIRVGTHAWYSYGASSTEKRDVRGSNAAQWAMMRDALAAGAHVYDLRGITDTLEADDSHVGLIQFKVGTGGQAVELRRRVGPAAQQGALPRLQPLHGAPVSAR